MGTGPKQLLLEQGLIKTLRIMKLTAVLLFFAALQVSAKGIAQEKITLSVSNASLEKVFGQIEAQTGFVFIYKDETVKDKKVTIQVTNVTLSQALDECLKGQALSYQIVGKSVAIKAIKKDTDQVGGVLTGAPPFIDVRGRVVNEKGEPVEGVTVTVKGHSKKTLTDKNGEFSLATVEQDATLLFTHITMESFEVKVSGKTELVINLRTKVSALGDVVVTVNTGYQQIPKERSTGSFGVINNEQVNRKSGTDILSRLEGVTTGIQFDKRQMQPNKNSLAVNNILVRGMSTLTEDMKSPLIVIDNFAYDGDINNINPNDIENITILKDAAAASIWGARAGNGVIVLTTKRGQYNQPFRLSVNTNAQITSKPNLFAYPAMNSSDYIDLEQFLFDKGAYDILLADPSYPALSPVVEILAKKKANSLTAQQAAAQIDALRELDVRNDFDKYVYRTGINNQYSLSLNGGSAKAKYLVTAGYDKSSSTLKGNDYRRITLRASNQFMPVKNLEINVGLVYTNSLAKNNSQGDYRNSNYNQKSRALYPYAQFADEDGNALAIAKDYRTGYTDTAGANKLLDWKYRPLDELKNSDNKYRLSDVLLNIGANYKLTSFLSFNVNYQFENSHGETRNLYNANTYFARNLINLFTQLQGTNVNNIIRKGGILDLDQSEMTSHIGRGQINVNKNWNSVHEISGIFGGEIRERKATRRLQRFYGFDDNKYTSGSVDYINNYPQYGNRGSAKILDRSGVDLFTDHFVSLYSNLAYTYKGKYTVSGSARQDAANVFGIKANNRWKPLWTAGASWSIDREEFYKSNLVPYLRLRATYGYQGNVNTSMSPNTIISYNSTNNIANLPYAIISNPANPELAWESIRQLNLGLDFKIGQRVSGTMDFYSKKSSNLLWNKPIDPTVGVPSVKSNYATMTGKGVEVSLNTVNLKGAFQWNSEIGLTHNTNRVIDYAALYDKNLPSAGVASGNGLVIMGRRGKSPYPLFSYQFAGLDPNTGDPLGYLGKNVSNDYKAILNQVYDTASLIYHGSSIPTVFGFFNNIFKYKEISLTVSVNYTMGYYFRKNTISYYGLINSGLQHADYEKRWKQAGDENVTNVPSFVYPLSNDFRDQFYASSSANVYKGDNVRLQNIRLAYSLTRSRIKALPFQSIQVYGNAENLGILWRANDAGLDPDYNTGNAAFPVPKTFTIGVQLSL
ncbi:SusC/RagA family TonB-linked outer membrane protein [Niastella sp. OAS944]|uniref:SusC/RagA family TonB-linked outer membrane protein n=1 Tax=Niastella sp. OAS944 TaxID=2664089 RepID=UPI003470F2BC|nr:TonB-linked SusC/RagA family outer membrane protein [Chitinophagaceae bacterium OAS944]